MGWHITVYRVLLAAREFLGLLGTYRGGRGLWGGMVFDIDLPLAPKEKYSFHQALLDPCRRWEGGDEGAGEEVVTWPP